jgi:hypothetical protein
LFRYLQVLLLLFSSLDSSLETVKLQQNNFS